VTHQNPAIIVVDDNLKEDFLGNSFLFKILNKHRTNHLKQCKNLRTLQNHLKIKINQTKKTKTKPNLFFEACLDTKPTTINYSSQLKSFDHSFETRPGQAGRSGTRPTRGWNRTELMKK